MQLAPVMRRDDPRCQVQFLQLYSVRLFSNPASGQEKCLKDTFLKLLMQNCFKFLAPKHLEKILTKPKFSIVTFDSWGRPNFV